MTIAAQTQLVVKRTFLDIASPAKAPRNRAHTDSALFSESWMLPEAVAAAVLDSSSNSDLEEPPAPAGAQYLADLSVVSDASTEAPQESRSVARWEPGAGPPGTHCLPESAIDGCAGHAAEAWWAMQGQDGWAADPAACWSYWVPYHTGYYAEEPSCGQVVTPPRQQAASGRPGRSAPRQPAVPRVVPPERSAPVAGAAVEPQVPDGPRTTVMLRNVPETYTRAQLMETLKNEGFEGVYNFVYLPVDFNSMGGLGYAFVNLTTEEDAARFWEHFDGFTNWLTPGAQSCTLNWSTPHQGLEAHIERYRNSPVMHECVPDECKPIIFVNGVRSVFPPPTKKLKAPRIRVRA